MGWRSIARNMMILGLTLALPLSFAGSRGPVSHLDGPFRPLETLETWQAPTFDHRAAAAAPSKKGEALLVGKPFEVDITPDSAGIWEPLTSEGRVWRLRLASDEALWMVLGFDRFEIPEGTTLHLVGQGGKHVQTYTHEDVQPHGQLWTAPVPGDNLIVELHQDREQSRQDLGLHLSTVSHGYRPWGAVGREALPDKGLGDSGSCNIDVVCSEGDDWRDEIRGAVLILQNGFAACSGSLINSTEQNCTNNVLTANHCFTAAEAPSLSFQFNFERPNCGSGIPAAAQVVTGGATFRAASGGSDFYLAEMLGDIPDAYQPYYNGWSRSTTAATTSTGIHHPAGDAKKISHNFDPLVSNGSYWRVTEWEEGTTEGGSSGSPIFDQNRLIVGQLFGGFASCVATNEWDEYGKISTSWTGGGSTTTRLSNWLDPLGTAPTTLPGRDFAACQNAAIVQLADLQPDDSSGGNGDGIADPAESIVLTVDATNSGAVLATEVSGTLSTSTPGVAITGPTANFPDIAPGATETSFAPHFEFGIDETFECGTPIDFTLSLTAAESLFATESNFSLPTGTESFEVTVSDDMESGTAIWSSVTSSGGSPWSQSTADSNSPTTSWFVRDTATQNDQQLVLDTLTALEAGSQLTFFHRFNTEPNWDGGVLEYRVNGGSWLDAGALITLGGYSGGIQSNAASALAGRSAWAGSNGGWTQVAVDLSSLTGSNVDVRWRFASDTSVSSEGWYVDDVEVKQANYTCADTLPGEAAGPGSSAQFTMDHARGLFDLNWSPPSNGSAPAGYRLYSTPLVGSYSPTCQGDLGAGTSSTVSGLPDNSAFLLVAYNAAGEGSYGSDSTGTPRTPAQGGDVCPNSKKETKFR